VEGPHAPQRVGARIPEETASSSASLSRWLSTLLVLAVGVAIFSFAYGVGERRQATQLAAEKSQIAATLSQTQSQVDALMARLNAMSAQVAAPPSQPQPGEVKPQETPRPAPASVTSKARRPHAVENQRLKMIENQLADQQKAIATAQQDLEKTRADLEGKLNSTQDELNGSIAKTHDELVALEKKGERNYYEFDLEKSKHFRHVGPLTLSLRKISVKHEYFDMAVVVDDREIGKKHVNLYEPVWIYPADNHQPHEVVVNQISKSGVHGYISTPKYTESETTTGASGAAAGTAPAGSSSASGSTPSGGSSATTQDSLARRPAERL
jgi:hypothetical protein